MYKLKRHEHILHMHEYFYEKISGKIIYIFDLMDSNVFELIQSQEAHIPEAKIKLLLYQILKGLDYLHRQGFFHRDIKPENILVKYNGLQWGDDLIELIKLGDLGSVRGVYSKQPYTEYISTRWYRSPECLLTVGHYGPKMDVWATGCVFYEIFTFEPLFPGANEIDQITRIHQVLGTPSNRTVLKLKSRSSILKGFKKEIGTGLGPLIKDLSMDGQAVLRLMLQYDPDIRISSNRLLHHRYFSQLRKEERSYHKADFPGQDGDAHRLFTNSVSGCPIKTIFQNENISNKKEDSSNVLQPNVLSLDVCSLKAKEGNDVEQLDSILAKNFGYILSMYKNARFRRSASNLKQEKLEQPSFSSRIFKQSSKKSRFKGFYNSKRGLVQ